MENNKAIGINELTDCLNEMVSLINEKLEEVVPVKSIVQTFEDNIICFIQENIDEDHFSDSTFNSYDKDVINKKLSKKSSKKLAKIAFAGSEYYNLVRALDIKIHRSAFHFIAYLHDLKTGEKTIEQI